MANFTQEEFDGFYRYDFVNTIVKQLEVENVKFLTVGSVNDTYTVIELKQVRRGGWSINVGEKHWYTYKISDVISLLEDLYDEPKLTIKCLKGEFQFNVRHFTANVEAE
jgi:hypothetical protein